MKSILRSEEGGRFILQRKERYWFQAEQRESSKTWRKEAACICMDGLCTDTRQTGQGVREEAEG